MKPLTEILIALAILIALVAFSDPTVKPESSPIGYAE